MRPYSFRRDSLRIAKVKQRVYETGLPKTSEVREISSILKHRDVVMEDEEETKEANKGIVLDHLCIYIDMHGYVGVSPPVV